MAADPQISVASGRITESGTRDRSIYRTAVMQALARMQNGALTMTLPDGDTVRFGRGENPRGSRFGLDARINVVRDDFFRRCFYYADIGLAEAYMAGDWTTDDLAEAVSWFILNAGEPSARQTATRRLLNWLGWLNRLGHRLRSNTIDRSRENIAAHYDLSNEFFSLFLDSSLTYSSGIFEHDAVSLEDAQFAKYERLCRLLQLKPGDRVLEIGSGWGAMSRHMAARYGCHVTTITISEKQFAVADQRRREERLEESIDLRLLDYRKLTGRYDKIVSIEMLEAVGHEYFDEFFGKCAELLEPNGLMALQVITFPDSRYDAMRQDVDFIQKHIFPGGLLPSVGAMLDSVRRTSDLMPAGLFEFGDSYARTLQLWSDAFESRLTEVRALGFDGTFIRKWRYYLMYCKAAFQMRHVSVVQMLLTRPNNHSLEKAGS
jgi:cyclopropane-fatty-acyl-phospholipid synthase